MKSFNNKQITFMKKLGLNLNFSKLSDNDVFAIEDIVATHLQSNGFDKEYNPTKDGLMCESILDTLSEI